MNKFTCTAVSFVLLAGFSLPLKAASVPVPTAQTIKTLNTKTNIKGWDVTAYNVRYLGPKVQGQYQLYEAAGTWIAVTVTVRNTTGQRQRPEDAPLNSLFAELIDTSGNKHDLNETELKYDVDLLSKPFAPNETRTEVWLFDVPEGTRASQLVLDPFGDGVPLQLR